MTNRICECIKLEKAAFCPVTVFPKRRMDMKKYVFAVIMVIAGYASTLSAAEIPKGLIDSKPDMAVLVSLDSWYASHPSPGKPGIVSETVFASPRSMVMVRTAGKG